MAQWIGYMVSIKCDNDLAYQGEIHYATTKQITLRKAFCNGIPCPENEVVIEANAIVDLKLIEKQSSSPQQRSTITIAKPIAKRAGRTQSTSELSNSFKMNVSHTLNAANNGNRMKNDVEPRNAVNNEMSFNGGVGSSKNGCTPNTSRRDKNKKLWPKGSKDEECFGSPLNHDINKEFDFEKNLALFNKQAFMDEINAHRPDVIKNIDNRKSNNYRHDENIIAGTPAIYRQITVPKQDFCEYVTDEGLIIPSISRSLRKRLWDVADRIGVTWERRVELIGRAATELSVQLIGGGHRLNPHNSHQWPTVVVFCGPHKQGAMGMNAARQLASHGIRVIVYAPNGDSSFLKKELQLFILTKNRVVRTVKELPTYADLIIMALYDDGENQRLAPDVGDWTNKNRAPILALDPPPAGMPGVEPKFSLVPVLPLPHASRNGKLYLCNLGFPVEVFNEVDIKYRSPFGPKFVIPLHPKDD